MSDINRPLTGFRLVEVQFGDTLQKIAARELGDASRWRDLITINSLSYPYLTGDPNVAGDRVKLYGSLIAVPSASASIGADIDPAAVFKTDIKMSDGILLTDGSDFVTVTGRDNYKQAIKNRIDTEQGELIYHLPYGCGVKKMLGTVNGPTRALLAAQYVKSAVQADPRTASVNSSTGAVSGDAIVVNTEAVPIAGAPISVSQVF